MSSVLKVTKNLRNGSLGPGIPLCHFSPTARLISGTLTRDLLFRCLKHDHALPCQYLCFRHPFIPPLKHTHGLKSQIWCVSHTVLLVRARAKARKQRFFAPGDAAARARAKKGRKIALARARAGRSPQLKYNQVLYCGGIHHGCELVMRYLCERTSYAYETISLDSSLGLAAAYCLQGKTQFYQCPLW